MFHTVFYDKLPVNCQFDPINQMLTLLVFTLSGLHCYTIIGTTSSQIPRYGIMRLVIEIIVNDCYH